MRVPRIDSAEVVSFRLDVPRAALERLPEEMGALGLQLRVERVPGAVTVRAGEGVCALTFDLSERYAQLAAIKLEQDERGRFFQSVLGPLMVRFGGDLVAKLRWSEAERNADSGGFEEVRVEQGLTTYPGLEQGVANVVSERAVNALSAGQNPLAPEGPDAIAEAASDREDAAVTRLLAQGRAEFERYQRANREPLR